MPEMTKKVQALNDNIIVEVIEMEEQEKKGKIHLLDSTKKEFHAGPDVIPKAKVQRCKIVSLGDGMPAVADFLKPRAHELKEGDVIWVFKDIPYALPNGWNIVKFTNIICVEK